MSYKYCPTSAKDDYLYYVEGYRYPKKVQDGKNVRWRSVNGNILYPNTPTHVHRPSSPNYNQVLYCNPQFTADSSQATIPFDSESEDRRLRNYAMQRGPNRFPQPLHKWSSNVNSHTVNATYIPSSHSYVKSHAPIMKKDHLENCNSSSSRYKNYSYANDQYSDPKQLKLYSEHDETESETALEEEYTESEDESVYSKYVPRTETKPVINVMNATCKSMRDINVRTVSVAKMMKNINAFNRNQPGKKIHPTDLEALVHRLRTEPPMDEKYTFKKPRCLDSSYKKAAEVLKNAKSNAKSTQSLKTESRDGFNPYEQYRRRQYSQLFLENSSINLRDRELALGRDASGNVYVGSQKHVKQISPQYSIIKPNTPESRDGALVRCAPIPEEQQSDSLEIKNVKKPSDNEPPVKLQKEINEPIRFTCNPVFHSQSEKKSLAAKDRLPIFHRSRRIPRRKRNLIGISSCAKALKQFTESSQIEIKKQSVIFSAPAKIDGHPEQPKTLTTSVATSTNTQEFIPEVKIEETSIHSSDSVITSNVRKSQVTLNVSSMISKLEEIENLINMKKRLDNKRDSSTSQSSLCNEGTSISTRYSGTESATESPRKNRKMISKHCPSYNEPIPEIVENNISNELIEKFDTANAGESNQVISFMSTKSAIASLISVVSTKLLSSNKSMSRSETDADIFKSIFHLKEPGTSVSKDITNNNKNPASKLKNKKCKNSSETSTANKKTHLHDTTTSTIVKCPRKRSEKTSEKTSSVVTVFPASKRNAELTAESATTNLASEIINDTQSSRKASKLPKPKRCTKVDDSSSDNSAYLVRPKYKGKKRFCAVESVPEETRVVRPSAINSLRSAFCIIVDFLFKYFRNLFIF